jgi:glycerophosphoryl diester phosphodiesterase
LFDGLPISPPLAPPAGGAAASALDARNEFYVINSLIQLMEDVYSDLHLEDNFDHPHVEGWMAVFRRWARQDAFQRTWAICRCTYADRFRRFYDDRLVRRGAGRRPLAFPTNFIASHRGRVKGGNGGNTIQNFREAVLNKADAIELDVKMLLGGTVVVFHDDHIRGVPVSTLDYPALLKLPGCQHVPTLADCLSELRGEVRLDIDLKDEGCVPKVLEAIREAAWSADDFVITSFRPEVPREIKAIREEVQAGLLLPARNLAAAVQWAMEKEQKKVVDFIAPEHGPALTQELLEACAEGGMPVLPWTVNDRKDIKDLFEHPAVMGIITDEVEVAREVRKLVR